MINPYFRYKTTGHRLYARYAKQIAKRFFKAAEYCEYSSYALAHIIAEDLNIKPVPDLLIDALLSAGYKGEPISGSRRIATDETGLRFNSQVKYLNNWRFKLGIKTVPCNAEPKKKKGKKDEKKKKS